MLVLIAESKTMAPCAGRVSPRYLEHHRPVFESLACDIMCRLESMTVDELASRVRISVPMARKLRHMIYDFPYKESGCTAIEAFTGVVFKAFEYSSLSAKEKEQTNRSVGIISSLYGWLRPDDIIKPYRFDFTNQLAPDGKSFAAFWTQRVTDCVLSWIEDEKDCDVLNLLPGDASRCIDWNRVEKKANVWKADFQEIQAGGAIKTPNSNRLKVLRGKLLRQIITDSISTPQQLMTVETECYVAEKSPLPGQLLFITA